MGACFGKPKKFPGSVLPTTMQDVPAKKNSRQRLSVLQVTTPNESSGAVTKEQFLEMYNRRGSGRFRRKSTENMSDKESMEQPKEEQGTVILINTKVLIEGSLSHQRQEQFEDKKVVVSGDSIPDHFLDDIGIAVACKKGLKPESPNQDDFCVLIDGESVVLGVFDGHGPYGHHVSNYIHTLLPKLLTQHESYNSNISVAMKDSFRKSQESLLVHCEHPETRFDCVISGSTATVVVLKPNELHTGFVGDSRALLARKKGDGHEIVVLAPDHKPMNPQERKRIESKNGEVKKLPFDIPYRVFFKGKEYPGLSMSRALGDTMAQEIGVSYEPEVISVPFNSQEDFVILCSDGVWEFVTNEEAVSLVSTYGKARVRQAAEQLAKLSWTRWIHNEGETVDDITVVIAYLPVSSVSSK